MVALQRKNPDLPVDAGLQMFSLDGSVTHEILESSAIEGELAHQRFYAIIEVPGHPDAPCVLSGEIDLFTAQDEALWDFKKVFVKGAGKIKNEHLWQLNCLKVIMENPYESYVQPFSPSKLRIIHLFRDWSAVRAYDDEKYPDKPYEILDVPVLPQDEVVSFMQGRIAQLRFALMDPDAVECTQDEIWMSGEKFTTMKTGGKVPRLFDTQEEAKQYISTMKKPEEYEFGHRPGRPIRCEFYCPAKSICNQYQLWLSQSRT